MNTIFDDLLKRLIF